MLHIFWLSCIYCIDKLVTCESTIEMKHLIFLFKNVTTWRQMLSVFCLIFKHFQISSNTFHDANSNQNEKKIAPPSSVCHGLPENAFQVNQLYNVTWSNVQYICCQYQYYLIQKCPFHILNNVVFVFRGQIVVAFYSFLCNKV